MFGKTALQIVGILAVLATIGGISLTAPAFAVNSNAGNSLTITDNDTTEQTNLQSSSQSATIDSQNEIDMDASNLGGSSASEDGDGNLQGDQSSEQSNEQAGVVANIQAQSSVQDADNDVEDNDDVEVSQGAASLATGDDSTSDASNDATIEDDDETVQGNLQLSDQEASIDSDNDIDLNADNEGGSSADESGPGDLEGDTSSGQSNSQAGIVANAQIQNSEQSAENEIEDYDDFIVGQGAVALADGDDSDSNASNEGSISDNDLSIQENEQGSSQSALIQSHNDLSADASNLGGSSASEAGDGNLQGDQSSIQSNDQTELVINAQIQNSEQSSENDLEDDDFFGLFSFALAASGGNESTADATNDASIDDSDLSGQINIQESSQGALIESDNVIEADAVNEGGSSANETGPGDLEGNTSSVQSNSQLEGVINLQVQNSEQQANNWADDRDINLVGQAALAGAFGNGSSSNAVNGASMNDTDEAIQGNGQTSTQLAEIASDNDLGSGNSALNLGGSSASEAGDGNLQGDQSSEQSNEQAKFVLNAQIQNSIQDANNDREDDDFFGLWQLAGSVADGEDASPDATNTGSIDDSDLVDQLNIQERPQNLTLDSDNTFEGEVNNTGGSAADESGPGDLEGNTISGQSNGQFAGTINFQGQFGGSFADNDSEDNDDVEAWQCAIAADNLLSAFGLFHVCLEEENGPDNGPVE
jgi:hypothetical protein